MVWLLKDNEVDMNEAPCRCRPFIETEAQMQERLLLKRWRIDLEVSQRRLKKDEREKRGNQRRKNSERIEAKRQLGTTAT